MLWAVRIPCAWLITSYIDGGYVMACLPISFVFGMLCMFSYLLLEKLEEDRKNGGGAAGQTMKY